MKTTQISVIFLLIILSTGAFANGDDADHEHEEDELIEQLQPKDYLPFDPMQISLYVFGFVLVLAAISFKFREKMSENQKKLVFAVIAVSVIGPTLYAAGSTVYLNVISSSQGPVHWHADFEIRVCGEQVTNIIRAEFPSNRVGTPTLHHHDDFRVHQEGLVVNELDASLKAFFQVIGGKLTDTSITIPLEDGSKVTYENGMLCPDGKEGKLKLLYKNGATEGKFVESEKIKDYVMSPFTNTILEGGQGDALMIVFNSE
jgi:hypothetical protein